MLGTGIYKKKKNKVSYQTYSSYLTRQTVWEKVTSMKLVFFFSKSTLPWNKMPNNEQKKCVKVKF